jgi:hypothetical protein
MGRQLICEAVMQSVLLYGFESVFFQRCAHDRTNRDYGIVASIKGGTPDDVRLFMKPGCHVTCDITSTQT